MRDPLLEFLVWPFGRGDGQRNILPGIVFQFIKGPKLVPVTLESAFCVQQDIAIFLLACVLTITQRLTMVKPFRPTSSSVRNPKTCVGDVKKVYVSGWRFSYCVYVVPWRAAVL